MFNQKMSHLAIAVHKLNSKHPGKRIRATKDTLEKVNTIGNLAKLFCS